MKNYYKTIRQLASYMLKNIKKMYKNMTNARLGWFVKRSINAFVRTHEVIWHNLNNLGLMEDMTKDKLYGVWELML